MYTTESKTKSIKAMVLEMTDSIGKLDFMLEQIKVLTEDICINFLDRVDLKTERGKFIAQYDLDIARVKGALAHNQMVLAVEKTRELLELSNSALAAVKGQAD